MTTTTTRGTRGRLLPVMVLTAAVLGTATATSQAQEPGSDTEATTQVAVADAHIEGSGPWTSWLGAAPDRDLVITVVNTGNTVIDDAELLLTFGQGADPAEPVTAPDIGRLEPGQSSIVRVALDMPTFAIGTYAVEGEFPETDVPVRFRAETSHIPWVPLLIPLLILVQLALVAVRNRIRDRIHRPAPAAEPTPPPPLDLESIIAEELGAVFDEAFSRLDDSVDDDEFRTLVAELAATAAEGVAARTELNETERAALDAEMTDAVLDAFGLSPATPARPAGNYKP